MRIEVIPAEILLPPIFPHSRNVAKELIKSIFPEEKIYIIEDDIRFRYTKYIIVMVPKRNYYYLFIKNKPTLLLTPTKKLDRAVIEEIAYEFSVPVKPHFVRKTSCIFYTDSQRYDYRYKVEREAYVVTNDILDSDELKTAIKEMLRATVPDLSGNPTIQEFTTEKTFNDVLNEVIKNGYPYLHYISAVQRSARKETLLIVRHFHRWFWTKFAEEVFR